MQYTKIAIYTNWILYNHLNSRSDSDRYHIQKLSEFIAD